MVCVVVLAPRGMQHLNGFAQDGLSTQFRGQDSAIGKFFSRMAGRNDVIIRCDPGYEWGGRMWDALLGDLPKEPKDFAQELKEAALFAMDSIWIRGEYDPDCPDCGGKASGAAR